MIDLERIKADRARLYSDWDALGAIDALIAEVERLRNILDETPEEHEIEDAIAAAFGMRVVDANDPETTLHWDEALDYWARELRRAEKKAGLLERTKEGGEQ